MEELTSSELLEKTADVMEQKGWNSGNRHASDGTVCVLGALEDALGGRHKYGIDYNHPILPLLSNEIGLTYMGSRPTNGASYACALASWSNSLDGPTVIGWLRKIAHRLQDAVTI